jgi:hypothetical protein
MSAELDVVGRAETAVGHLHDGGLGVRRRDPGFLGTLASFVADRMRQGVKNRTVNNGLEVVRTYIPLFSVLISSQLFC